MPHVSIFIQESSIYFSIEIKQVTLPIKLIPLLGFLLVVFKVCLHNPQGRLEENFQVTQRVIGSAG
jgi:hypothetical protein